MLSEWELETWGYCLLSLNIWHLFVSLKFCFFIIILMVRLEQKGEDSTHLFFLAQKWENCSFQKAKAHEFGKGGKNQTDGSSKWRFHSLFHSKNIYQVSSMSQILNLYKGKWTGNSFVDNTASIIYLTLLMWNYSKNMCNFQGAREWKCRMGWWWGRLEVGWG